MLLNRKYSHECEPAFQLKDQKIARCKFLQHMTRA
jgi:hypothetical protein